MNKPTFSNSMIMEFAGKRFEYYKETDSCSKCSLAINDSSGGWRCNKFGQYEFKYHKGYTSMTDIFRCSGMSGSSGIWVEIAEIKPHMIVDSRTDDEKSIAEMLLG
jgi:hypothetical protein